MNHFRHEMCWKIFCVSLLIIILICCAREFSHNIYISKDELRNNQKYSSIVFDESFDMKSLDKNITDVMKVIAPVPYSMRGLIPMTNRISHWFICVRLDDGSIIVVNNSSRVFLNVYPGMINDKILTYNKCMGIIKKSFDVKDMKMSLGTFLNRYIILFTENFDSYTIFGKHNCQSIVSVCLKNIFKIHDEETRNEHFGIDLINEIRANKHFSTNFENVLHHRSPVHSPHD